MDATDVLDRLESSRLEAERGHTGGEGPSQTSPWGQARAVMLASLRAPLLAPARGPMLAAIRGSTQLASAVLGQLRDPLTPVLLIGAAASAVLGSGVDSTLVGGVMVGNAIIGGVQRMRTERALHKLLVREQQPGRRVRREPGAAIPADPGDAENGRTPTDIVPADELQPGDVIALRPNDVVPADARILVADALELDESTLTGESMPVSKDPAPTITPQLAERASMVYEGTTVLSGAAFAVVVATGEASEAGRAGAAASGAAPPAGVQARLAELTSMALPATGLGGLAVTGLGMLRGMPLRQAVASGVAVAVAAVPEGLPLVSTVAQLSAARRLSRRGVLVRSARTLEALGRVDVICFDKTGTLTEGRLQVAGAAALDGDVEISKGHGRHVLKVAARACPVPGERRIAHATDQAILDAAATHLGDPGWKVHDEVPFQGSRGYSASLGQDNGRLMLAVKGAPEILLDRCTAVSVNGSAGGADGARQGTADGGRSGNEQVKNPGRSVPLTAQRRRSAHSAIQRLAAEGLRVLAVAERTPSGGKAADDLVDDLTLTGFITIADVMRPDTLSVVKGLAGAGVRTIMITGDHPATASAIARKAGIPGADKVVTGAELDGLAKDKRRGRVDSSTVFARVSPEQKVRIISDLRHTGHVVAMTGDGTNDAAAIRLADVGIGVAARGSTAARGASDLVLPGGNISRIEEALREGRALWRSVREAVSILIGGNAGEIAFMVLGTAMGGRSPLGTRQLLLVNMLTDMFPALAVALGKRTQDEHLEAAPAGPLIGEPLARTIAIRGGATALGGTLAWTGGRLTGRSRRASTMGLAAVVGTQLAQTVIAGSRSPVVVATSVASGAALVAIVNTPVVSQFFGCTPLGPAAWGIVAGSAGAATLASLIVPRMLPPEAEEQLE